jgi:hypothetical protein
MNQSPEVLISERLKNELVVKELMSLSPSNPTWRQVGAFPNLFISSN